MLMSDFAANVDTPCPKPAACCRAHSPEDGRLLQSLRYHKDLVTCVAASSGEAAHLFVFWGLSWCAQSIHRWLSSTPGSSQHASSHDLTP
jgi:hypothetical protein